MHHIRHVARGLDNLHWKILQFDRVRARVFEKQTENLPLNFFIQKI